MCGIVGLLLKNPAWDERLGELLVPMLVGMTERGPDSAGMAVFGKPIAGETRLSFVPPAWRAGLARREHRAGAMPSLARIESKPPAGTR